MKLGIILFSHTGNTRSIGEDLKRKLMKAGHNVKIEEVQPDGDPQKMGNDIKFKTKPSVKGYDAIIFGSPVWGFSLPPMMKGYLNDIGSLKGKKIALFVTKKLPFHWTGGNRTVSQMENICSSKGGIISGKGVIVYGKSGPEKNKEGILNRLSNPFK